MDLNHVAVEKALEEAALEEYERGVKLVHQNLAHLRCNLALYREIITFQPSPHYSAPAFFRFVCMNLFHQAVIIVWRIWGDDDPACYTLKKLGTLVKANVRSGCRKAVFRRLRATRLDRKRLQHIMPRVDHVRHKLIAHLDREFNLDFEPIGTEVRLTLSHLEKCCEIFGTILNALAFNREYSLMPEIFWPGADGRSVELGYLFDALVVSSCRSTLFDRNRKMWEQAIRPKLTAADLAELNAARARHGLPEMPSAPPEEANRAEP